MNFEILAKLNLMLWCVILGMNISGIMLDEDGKKKRYILVIISIIFIILGWID
jgi:hypothetical protein